MRPAAVRVCFLAAQALPRFAAGGAPVAPLRPGGRCGGGALGSRCWRRWSRCSGSSAGTPLAWRQPARACATGHGGPQPPLTPGEEPAAGLPPGSSAGGGSNSASGSGSGSGQAAQRGSPTAPTDVAAADDALSAFDQFLEESGLLSGSASGAGGDLGWGEEDGMSKRDRRALALEREREFKREQHWQKLEVLAALPDDLVVQQVADKCPGCGCELQSDNEALPGYLPEDIRLQRAQDLIAAAQAKAAARKEKQLQKQQQRIQAENSPPRTADNAQEATTTALHQSPDSAPIEPLSSTDELALKDLNNPDAWEEVQETLPSPAPDAPFGNLLTEDEIAGLRSVLVEEGVDLEDESASRRSGAGPLSDDSGTIVCQRCFRLNNYGVMEPGLRVESPRKLLEMPKQHLSVERGEGDAGEDVTPVKPGKFAPGKRVLTAATFRKNLERLRSKPAVIVYLVDVFDFHGTFLAGLRDLIGDRSPVIMAVNKVDLLPKDYKPDRVERWVRHEARSLGLEELESVHLISSTRGTGVKTLLAESLSLARKRRCNIYVVGAANVGKSSFINHIMSVRMNQKQYGKEVTRQDYRTRKKSGVFKLTTSVIPGTTLDVIRVPLDTTVSLYDTPGIIMSHQLTNSLDPKELRAVLPGKSVERVSLRLGEGKALFLGGLARIEVLEGRPFFFTAFVSSGVKVHPGRVEDADDFTKRHVGDLLTPPYDADRLEELGEWASKSFTAEGEGWKRSCVDIVLSGLGWVSLTGAGSIRVRIWTPRGVGVFTREALMPFEVRTSGVGRYTGTTTVNVREASRAARKRKTRRSENEDMDTFF